MMKKKILPKNETEILSQNNSLISRRNTKRGGNVAVDGNSTINTTLMNDKEIKSDNFNAPTSVNNFSRWQFNTKPLGLLSLQYNFGRD